MILPRGVAQPAELGKHLNALAPFPPGVVNLRYTIENDWSGDSVIFFWITLSDEAARRPVLPKTAGVSQTSLRNGLTLSASGV